MSIYRSLGIFACLACLTFIGGCASGGGGEPTTAPTTTASSPSVSKAVMVTTGNGGSVLYLSSTDGSLQTISTEGAPICNQCAEDAAAYFKTGHLDPICAVCGAHRTALIYSTSGGHN